MESQVIYNNLDYLYSAGRINEVESYLKGGLLEAYENEEYDIAIILLNELMNFFRKIGKGNLSLATAEELLQLLNDLRISGTITYATSCINIAATYLFTDRNQEAIELYREVDKIFRENMSGDDFHMVNVYNNMSMAYQNIKDYKNALEYARKAYAIVDAKPDSVVETAVTNTILALVHLRIKDLRLAGKHIREAIRIFEKNAPNDSNYAAALSAEAAIFFEQGEYGLSVQKYKSALDHMKKHFGLNKDYGLTCMNYADALEKNGETKSADEFRKLGKSTLNSIE